MTQRANPFRNIRFMLRPAPRKLKVLFVALILACTAALIALGVVRARIGQQTQQVLDKAAELEQENKDLEEKKENLGSLDSIEQIAREELGMVDPDIVIIDPEGQEPTE